MSVIWRDQRIEVVEQDVEYLKSLIDEGIAEVEAQVQDHEVRISTIEARPYPEALRDLSDVNIQQFDDQKVVKYDLASDKFVLGDVQSGIQDVPNDGKRYV